MNKEEAINTLIKMEGVNANNISDGYHTFGELYDHRIELFIALCRILFDYEPDDKVQVWMTKKHSDGSEFEGWFILGLFTEQGKQISYHLPMSRWKECTFFANQLSTAPEFDGHTSQDVLKRLREL